MDSTKRFSNRVENYIKYRPGYPAEAIDFVTTSFGLHKDAVIADIGSGTGILTKLFLEKGYTVFAVEPNGPMREAAGQALSRYSGFHSVDGTAEQTTLPAGSINLIVAGQAAHWFHPPLARREFLRIAAPGAGLALIWNERKTGTPFLKDYEALLNEFATDYKEVNHANLSHEQIAAYFSPAPCSEEVFKNEQLFDFDGLKGRLLSSSYALTPGQPRYDEMIAGLQKIFDKHHSGGIVRFEYDTKVYWGKMVSGQ